jgi:uncharacterized protein (UPF0335 family)
MGKITSGAAIAEALKAQLNQISSRIEELEKEK